MIILFPYPLNAVIVLLLDTFGICLSFWVYRANKLSKVNRGFSLMVASILAWITFYHFAQYDNSTFWYRLSVASVFLFLIAYYFFIVRWFLQKSEWYKSFGIFVLLYGLIFGILSVTTNLIIADSETLGQLLTKPVLGYLGWWILYIFAMLVTLVINWALIKDYLTYSKENKLKIQYFLMGLIIFAGLNIIFNIIIPVFFNDYRLYEIGNYSLIFFLVFTAYAIVKHKLFDVKILISQLLVFMIWTFVATRVALSTSRQELLINSSLALLVFISGILLLRSISKEKELAEKLHKELSKKTGELIKKMEDIVKE